MTGKKRLTYDEAHATACAAMAKHSGIRRLVRQFGDALFSSLAVPSEREPSFVEVILIGESSLSGEVAGGAFVDDPSEKTYQLAACRVSPITGETQVVIEDKPKVVHPANTA